MTIRGFARVGGIFKTLQEEEVFSYDFSDRDVE